MARSWICITVIRAAGKGRRDKDGPYRNSIGEHQVGGVLHKVEGMTRVKEIGSSQHE